MPKTLLELRHHPLLDVVSHGRSRPEGSIHLSADQIEYMRWKGERGIKTKHILPVIAHDPMFVLRNARKMMKHTYRGSTWRNMLGLEDDHKAFARYKEIRRQEREYL